MTAPTDSNLIQMTADIVSRAARTSRMNRDQLVEMISGVHDSLVKISRPAPEPEPEPVRTKRKYTRRAKVEQPAPAPASEVSEEIVDEAEARTQIVEDIVQDEIEEIVPENELSEDDNVVGEITLGEDGELVIPKRPEPMFED